MLPIVGSILRDPTPPTCTPPLPTRPLQNSEEDQFLFETSVQAGVRDTVATLARVHNLRHRITRLKLEGEELAKHGPAKQPDQQGIDSYSSEGQQQNPPAEHGPHYCMDPTGRRTGFGACAHLSGETGSGNHLDPCASAQAAHMLFVPRCTQLPCVCPPHSL